MKILSIQPFPSIKRNNFIIQKKNKFKELQVDTVSFSSKKSETPMYDDFMSKMRKVYPNKTAEDVLKETISKQENRLGEGVKKIVYSIDGIDDYVVALMKKGEEKKGSKLTPVKDPFPGFNFGQEIATNNGNLIVMKRIFGDLHSIPDWTKKYQGVVYRGEDITQEDAQLFLTKLSDVESLPIESYVDFAQQVKYLTDKRIKIDMFNPNNIIVDPQSKKITYFDLFENPSIFHCLGEELNGTQDMINILCDALLHGQYAKVLGQKEQEELISKTKSISEKCHIAGAIVGLSDDSSIAYRTYKFLQDRLHKKDGRNTKYLELYSDFQRMYNLNDVE